jgi:hypothetical protein
MDEFSEGSSHSVSEYPSPLWRLRGNESVSSNPPSTQLYPELRHPGTVANLPDHTLTLIYKGDCEPEQVAARKATGNLWNVLGVQPLKGRLFTEAEDLDGAQVVVISLRPQRRRGIQLKFSLVTSWTRVCGAHCVIRASWVRGMTAVEIHPRSNEAKINTSSLRSCCVRRAHQPTCGFALDSKEACFLRMVRKPH